ncbi:MAG: cation:proton antiporter [Actinomycetota bacterium]
MSNTVVIGLAAIVIIGVAAQWLAAVIRVPSILLLLSAGLIAGPILGWLNPDELFGELLDPFVSLAVGVILFEGGLSLKIRELEGVAGVTWRLVSFGAITTWIALWFAAAWLLDLPQSLAALLGAILIVSGPTVIIPLLRQVRPTRRISAILKWEGIMIDAIGAMLAVIVFETIISGQIDRTLGETIQDIGIFLLVGAGVGGVIAAVMIPLLRRFRIPEFLHSGASLMMALLAFTIANLIRDEAGLLATIVLGLALANQPFVSVKTIVEFSETIRMLLIAVLFIVLAAQLDFRGLLDLGFGGLALLAFAILVARPLAVMVSSIGSGLERRERLFVSAVAPRGIVAASISSVFATELAIAGVEGAEMLVPAAFLVILGTAFVYGLGAAPLARRLGVALPDPRGVLIVGADLVAREIAHGLQAAGVEVTVVATNRSEDYSARMSGLTTRYTSVLNERIDERLLFNNALVMALTLNDEYNSLICLHLSEYFGQGGTFQMRRPEGTGTPRTTASPQLRGRLVFGGDLDHRALESRLADGQEIKATTLSESFNYEAYQKQNDDSAGLLFIIDSERRVLPRTVEKEPKRTPRPGEKVVAIVPPDPKKAKTAAKATKKDD